MQLVESSWILADISWKSGSGGLRLARLGPEKAGAGHLTRRIRSLWSSVSGSEPQRPTSRNTNMEVGKKRKKQPLWCSEFMVIQMAMPSM